jgi:arginase family enzyme/predicted acetyltransferase
MLINPLSALQVIAVRYIGSRPAVDDERALDAYAASGVYGSAGVPFAVVEPAFPEEQREEDDAANVGRLCGAIAEAVATARLADQAVLLTGGNCAHAPGVLGGLQDAHGPAARIGLVWFDAHGDFNTPHTTLTGSLGGMPVAVCAGLGLPQWRERAHLAAPLPTDRIVLVGPRNLDPEEERLIRSTDVVLAAPARGFPGGPIAIAPVRTNGQRPACSGSAAAVSQHGTTMTPRAVTVAGHGPAGASDLDMAAGFPGADLPQAVARLADRCDLLYLHIDADILDRAYVPNHRTGEPNGPDMAQVQAAIDTVMVTGKVAALALVSVYGAGEGSATSVASGIALLQAGLTSWQRYGLPGAGPEAPFEFLDPGPLADGDLELVLEERLPANPVRRHVPVYKFKIVPAGQDETLGHIDLRVGNPFSLVLYGGHIGYSIEPEHRGHHYAARACRLLMPLARRHGLHALWITCNPENTASRRTCELAGAEFVEIVDLPPESDMYQIGERRKCRYRLEL